MSNLRDGFWLLVLGFLVCFAFFFALGAVSTEAVGLLVVMGVLLVLYVVHSWLKGRNVGPRDPRYVHDRERRGF
jgi:membrane protein implicated in regulation of membrane protease activity